MGDCGGDVIGGDAVDDMFDGLGGWVYLDCRLYTFFDRKWKCINTVWNISDGGLSLSCLW